MFTPNIDVRLKAKKYRVPLWMIANELGVTECTVYRWLRVEFDDERRKLFEDIIDKVSDPKYVLKKAAR